MGLEVNNKGRKERLKKLIVLEFIKKLEGELEGTEKEDEEVDLSRGDLGDRAGALAVLSEKAIAVERNKKLKLSIFYLKELLKSIKVSDVVQEGSLVVVENGERITVFIVDSSYFPIGMVESNGIYAVSTSSPLGKSLLGRKVGETVVVNGRNNRILEVF